MSRNLEEKENKFSRNRKNFLAKSLAAIIIFSTVGVGIGCSKQKLNDLKNNIVDEGKNIIEKRNDSDIVPGKNIIYGSEKYAINVNDVSKMLKGENTDREKYVFLTFDDGPSANTDKVLDVLKNENVKATFFVLGERLAEGDAAYNRLKRTIGEGHAIGNHSYSHSLKKLYPNNKIDIDYFMSEFNKTNDLMKNILGKDFNTRVLRLPGGYNSRVYYNDPMLEKFNERLKKEGIVNIDWNALNGDAEGKPYTVEEMVNYAKKTSKDKNKIVILMHDAYGKGKTVEALPKIIKYYKDNGYVFKIIT